MPVGGFFRRVRAVLGNAVVWGAGWFAAGMVVLTGFTIADGGFAAVSWIPILKSAAKFGVVGAISGGAFSSFILLRYQGRRLASINWVRFGLGGGLVTGLFVPAFIVVMRLVSGDPFLPVRALVSNGILGAVLGGTAAGATLKLAQVADRLLPRKADDEPDLLEGGER